MKKLLSVIVIIIFFLSVGACKKKEAQSIPQIPVEQSQTTKSPVIIPPSETGRKVQFKIVVPPGVKDKWPAVKLIVKDKKLNKTQELTVTLGDKSKIPGSKLSITVGVFLPDFKMGAEIITSATNSPNNPAIGVKIFENGARLFPEPESIAEWGWLYSKHPDIHPFQHDRYALILKEGIVKE